MHTLGSRLGSMFSVRASEAKLARTLGRQASSALAKAKKLAKENGISVEKDSAGGWWVTCDRFSHDPLDGANFCATGQEVLDAVKAYVAAHA